MGSRLDARSWPTACAAVALAGGALYLSRGLNPRWWAVWVAALPVLWIAPRLPRRAAWGVAAAAGVLGGLGMWGYHARLQLPLASRRRC